MSKTLIYAHRGANREAVENTAGAFDRALDYAVDGIETDVQLSRDEIAVLWHDRYLNKLGWPKKYIDDFDYAQLREKNFSRHFHGSKGSESIMSLQDFLAAYRTRCRLLLEVKHRVREAPERWQLRMRQTLELAGEARDDVIVSSFHLASLVYAHGIAPQLPLVYNLEPEQDIDDAKQAIARHPFLHGLCVHISTLDEAMVTLLRLWKKSIAVYTCNTEREIGTALRLGVDILITDLPQLALQMRGVHN
jgi:glycerophosphoryl diester phosphodiesterase